jgi:uncharacterized PurR-regulated membrane protein YhhQ (DUF165 family)
MPTQPQDRWLLPRQQTDYPTRDFLPEATLHGRREATYLVLAAMFLVTTATLIVFEPSRMIDVAKLLPAIELPTAMVIPVGVIPFALSFVAITLVFELYGRRRATAVVWVGLFASLALVGLMRLADVVDRGNTFVSSFALAGGCAVAHACNALLFDVLRQRTRGRVLWLRFTASIVFAQLAGWVAYGAIQLGFASSVGGTIDHAMLGALAIGSAVCTVVCAVALMIPGVIAARGLALFLRIDRTGTTEKDEDPYERMTLDATPQRRLPPAVIVDDGSDGVPVAIPRRRAARPSIQPFSSAEMRFFSEGDQLTE